MTGSERRFCLCVACLAEGALLTAVCEILSAAVRPGLGTAKWLTDLVSRIRDVFTGSDGFSLDQPGHPNRAIRTGSTSISRARTSKFARPLPAIALPPPRVIT